MKKINCLLWLLAIVLVTPQLANAQKNSFPKGSIHYEIKIDGGESIPQMAAIKSVLEATDLGIYVNDKLTKLDMSMMGGMIAKMQVLIDPAVKGMSMLYDVPSINQKAIVKFDSTSAKKKVTGADSAAVTKLNLASLLGGQKPELKQIKGSKKIAGYKCKKAEMSLMGQTLTLFYSPKIMVPAYQKALANLGGFPLGLEMKLMGMTITVMAKDVDTKAPAADTFTLPSGYDVITSEEFTRRMMEIRSKAPIGM